MYTDSEELAKQNGAAVNAFDGNTSTVWHTRHSQVNPVLPPPHEIRINLGAVYDIKGFRYLPRQDNNSAGRIDRYEFYVSIDGTNWEKPVAEGTFANDVAEKEVSFTQKTGQYVCLRALAEIHGFAYISMAEINVLGALSSGNQPPNGVIGDPSWHMTIKVGDSVYFSGTGTDPDHNTPLTYRWNFGDSGIADSSAKDAGFLQFNKPGTFLVTFAVTDALGSSDLTPATLLITVDNGAFGGGSLIPQRNWSLRYVDSEELVEENGAARNAFDGDMNTFWHTRKNNPAKWLGRSSSTYLPSHEIQINLGAVYHVNGFRYLPRQDGSPNGRVKEYAFYVSIDGTNWGNPVIGGIFANDSTEKEILFKPTPAQFISLWAQTEVNANPWISMAEINVLHQSKGPSVQILQPQDYHFQESNDLYVSTYTCLDSKIHVGWGVKFTVDGGPKNGGAEAIVYNAPFDVTFSNLNKAEHIIDVFIVDNVGNAVSGDMTHDQVKQIGIGDYYVAVGDSYTFGAKDDDFSDNESFDRRNVGEGYTPILTNLLVKAKGYPQKIVNEGSPGDTTDMGLLRMPLIFKKHPNAGCYLVQFGTNDSSCKPPVPAGKGLEPGDYGYSGSFKDKMQQIITLINKAGKKVCLAKVPFTLCSQQINSIIHDYNMVIDELIPAPNNNITVTPPDFYTYFKTHPEEFYDKVHFNGAGYRSMAKLWFDALINKDVNKHARRRQP